MTEAKQDSNRDGAGAGDSSEHVLADLMAELSQTIETGGTVDLEKLVLEHPEDAESIRSLFPAMEMLVHAEASAAGGTADSGALPGSAVPRELTLGDYRIIRQAGRGGMGVVYEAEQISLGRRVALKVLPFAAVLDEKQIRRFKNEAHAAAQLHHNHIVPVYSVGSERGVHYYAMQYIEGQTVSDLIEDLKRLDAEGGTAIENWKPSTTVVGMSSGTPGRRREFYRSVARLGIEAAEALEHAHELGVVHRDIKPSNLLLDQTGKLWVTDFGLARLQDDPSLTMSGDLIGTLRYMSPEQALAKRIAVDHRTDIYSLGVTLYELLTLEPAYEGKDRAELLRQIAFEEPRPARRFVKSIPFELETIVLKAMAKNPGSRYASAQDLASDLGRFLEGKPIFARRPSVVERVVKWSLRHRALVVAAAAILIATCTLGGILYRDMRRATLDAYEHKVLAAVVKIEMGRPAVMQSSPTKKGDMTAPADPVEEAAWELEEATRSLPGRPEAFYHRARALDILDRPDEARADLARCGDSFAPARLLSEVIRRKASGAGLLPDEGKLLSTENSPAWTAAWIEARWAWEGRDWKRAVAGFEKLVSLTGSAREPYLGFSIEVRMGQGWAHMANGKFDEAIEDFAAAAALWPELEEPEILLARAYYRRGNRDIAEEKLQKIYSRSRSADETALKISVLLGQLSEYEKSLDWAAKARESAGRESQISSDLLALGRHDEACAHARRALELDPGDGHARTRLALALKALGRFDEACSELRRLVKERPRDDSAYFELSWVLYAQGKLEEVLDACREAMKVFPGAAWPHDLQSQILEKQGKVEEAIVEGRKAIELGPMDTNSLNNVGILLQMHGKADEAVALYQRALAVSPRDSFPHINLASLLNGQGKLEEALAETRKAIELDASNSVAYELLGEIQKRQHKLDEARDALEHVVRLSPDSAQAHFELGSLLEDMDGKLEDAIAAYRRALELDPKHKVARGRLGELLRRQKKLDEAISELKEVVKLDPGLAWAHSNLGVALTDKGLLDEAVAECRTGVELDTKSATAHDFLASALAARGKIEDIEEAIPEFAKAVELDPEIVWSKASLRALLERKTVKAPRGLESLEAAVMKSGRKDPELLVCLAQLEARTGRPGDAVLHLEEALLRGGPEPFLLTKLRECRRAALPDLLSYGSIDAALELPEVLVPEGAEWRYFEGRSEPSPGIEWASQLEFDDSKWNLGPSGFGYGDDDDATVLDDMKGSYTSCYVRHALSIEDPTRYTRFLLSVRADDGFVAYLNGKEVGRVLAEDPGTVVPFNHVADGDAPEPLAEVLFPVEPRLLRSGKNLLALQCLNKSLDSSDLSLVPVLLGESVHSEAKDRALLERFRSVAHGRDATKRLTYLEARILDRSGKHRESAEKLEPLLSDDDPHREPVDRLVENLRALGELARAEATLRTKLASKREPTRFSWELWFTLCAVDLKMSLSRMRASLPAEAPAEESPYLADFRWLLERLEKDGVVRIHCGGDEYTSKRGAAWGKDRFFLGGHRYFGDPGWGFGIPFPGEILGTEDDSIYQTNRWFGGQGAPREGYRIPLPPGRYRVMLHFAEIFAGISQSYPRRYDVVLEGIAVLENYNSLSPGFATADAKTFDVAVEDGFLDIEFLPRLEAPAISGIEVERVR